MESGVSRGDQRVRATYRGGGGPQHLLQSPRRAGGVQRRRRGGHFRALGVASPGGGALADLQEIAGALPVGLPTVDAPCFLCRSSDADPLWTTPDRAFAVPGLYTVARCRRCGFLYQKPRVDDTHLADCYPDHYPRHQEPSPRIPLKGSRGRIKAVRWALASALGYSQLRDSSIGLWTRLRARRLLRKIRWDCPPW